MSAAAVIQEIIQAGGEIWEEQGRVKFKGVPAHMVPLLRAHKAELLTLLSAPPAEITADDVAHAYDREERLAVQSEHLVPPDRGWDGVPMEPLPAPPAPKSMDEGGTPTMQRRTSVAPQSAPATVRCRDCARWTPGQTTEGIGRCTAPGNGPPPPGGSGYKAPYPNAPRRCPEYLGSAS